MNKVYVTAVVDTVTDEEIKALIPPMKSRRLGKLQKRALATALKAMETANLPKPDMILNGTSLGCMENTLKLLDTLHTEGESASMPTAFMQSTHNTISSLIAIYTNNHGYNATYSHGKISFECALQDAFLRIKSGAARTALVCKNDEITEFMSQQPLFFGNIHTEDISEAWVLCSEKAATHPLFEIENVIISHHDNQDSAQIIKKSLCD